MPVYDQQLTLDSNPEYAAFVEKFKPKKTTDDCYTPENIFDAVFGGGLLLSERAAAERAAAEKWNLSDRELKIIAMMGGEAT